MPTATARAQRNWPFVSRLRTSRPALLVVALHLGLLWLATHTRMSPVAAPSLPPSPPTVLLARIEPAQLPPAPPQPARPSPPHPARALPLAHPQSPPATVAPSPAPLAPAELAAPASPAASASSAASASAPALVPPPPPAPSRPPVVTSGVQYLIPPQPVYPAAARRRGDEGEVLLRVLINAQGGVEQIALERSSGIVSLDQAAREAVARARFQPYAEQGRAQAAYVVVPIRFQLTQ